MRKIMREFLQSILWSWIIIKDSILEKIKPKKTYCQDCEFGAIPLNNHPKAFCRHGMFLVKNRYMFNCKHYKERR